MAKKGRFQQQKVKKTGIGRKIFLTVLVLVLLLVAGAVAAGALYYNSMLNLVTRPNAVVSENVLSDEQLKEILGFIPEKLELTDEQTPAASEAEKSNSIVCTSSVIMEFSPPMIPARPIGFSPSQIISIVVSRFLSWPSSVTKVSPHFGN